MQIASNEREAVEERIRSEVAEGQYPQAFELLARTYYGMVFRYCFHMLGGEKARAEDVTQRVFVEVGQGMDRFRGEASVKGWLLAITHKVCLASINKDLRRFHLRHRHQDIIAYRVHRDPPQGLDSERLAADRERRLVEALNQLSREQRSLVVMRFGIGLQHEASIAELKQIARRSRATVYRDLKDALETLKRIMNDKDVDFHRSI